METVKVHQPLPDFTSNNPLFGDEISSCQSFFMFRILVILLRYILFKIFTYKLQVNYLFPISTDFISIPLGIFF